MVEGEGGGAARRRQVAGGVGAAAGGAAFKGTAKRTHHSPCGVVAGGGGMSQQRDEKESSGSKGKSASDAQKGKGAKIKRCAALHVHKNAWKGAKHPLDKMQTPKRKAKGQGQKGARCLRSRQMSPKCPAQR